MKTILYILIFHLGAISFAQDPQLFENDWYLQKLVLNGQDYFPPQNNETQNIYLEFIENPYYIHTAVCSGIASDIFAIDNDSFEVPGFAIIAIDCSLQESAIFEGYYFDDFFHWQASHSFGYSVVPGTNGRKVLTLTNQENDHAIYGNEPLATPDVLTPQFSIYPNPVKNELYLSAKNGNGKLDIKIFNIEGKLLKTENLNLEKPLSIDVSNLPSGIYFLNLSDENGNVELKKFIKE